MMCVEFMAFIPIKDFVKKKPKPTHYPCIVPLNPLMCNLRLDEVADMDNGIDWSSPEDEEDCPVYERTEQPHD